MSKSPLQAGQTPVKDIFKMGVRVQDRIRLHPQRATQTRAMIMQSLSNTQLVVLALLSIPAFYILRRTFTQTEFVEENPENQGVTITTTTEVVISESSEANDNSVDVSTDSGEPVSVMQAEKTDLDPPRDDPFTLEQLKEFDGSDPNKPIYVSIKGANQFSSFSHSADNRYLTCQSTLIFSWTFIAVRSIQMGLMSRNDYM